MDLLRVIAGEHRRARRPAARGVVELREAQTAFGERVEIRRLDFAAVTTEVGIAEVIGKDEKDVWPRGRFLGGVG